MDEAKMPVLLSSKPLKTQFSHLNKIALTSEQFTVGRHNGNSVTIPFLTISRLHCTFYKSKSNEWFIKDTSLFGIRINNKKINTKQHEVTISDGDIITFDPTAEFVYKFCNPEESYEIPTKRIKLILKNVVEKQKALLLEERDQQLAHMKNKMEGRISELMREKQELQEALRKETEELRLAQEKSALNKVGEIMENELQCSICTELFIEALTLNCSHTFCKYCITTWKKTKKDCAICRAPITAENRSIVLDSIIEKMVQNLSEEMKAKRQDILTFRADLVPEMTRQIARPRRSSLRFDTFSDDEYLEEEERDVSYEF